MTEGLCVSARQVQKYKPHNSRDDVTVFKTTLGHKKERPKPPSIFSILLRLSSLDSKTFLFLGRENIRGFKDIENTIHILLVQKTIILSRIQFAHRYRE